MTKLTEIECNPEDTALHLEPEDSAIIIKRFDPVEEVVRIEGDGRIFWKGREVETDEEFRGMVVDLCKYAFGGKG